MTPTAAEGRHASWLELFFDLVIVAAVAQLAHLLHDEHTVGDVALAALLYYAIWSVWTSFTLYANISGERTRTRAMLIAMFGIAVLAATVPNVLHGQAATAFAVAYLGCRIAATATWADLRVFTDAWPAAQQSAGLIFWVISIFVDPPVRYYLWAIAAVIEIAASVLGRFDPEATQERLRLAEERRRRRGGQPREQRPMAYAEVDQPHLGERLGLFVIIVLGEAVVQVVDAAAGAPADRALWAAGLAGFALLVCVWWLTLQYGSTAVPMFGVSDLPARITLPAHLAMTAGIVAVAAGLGAVAQHAAGHLPEPMRWLLCGGAALYFVVMMLVGVRAGAPARWVYGWALPAVVVPVVLGVVGGHVPAWLLVGLLLVPAWWQVLYVRVGQGRPPARLSQFGSSIGSPDSR
jgi:low temperature requirement protein LtrA